MQSHKPQSVSIALTGSNTGRTTEGRLYGSGEKAVIFSNMDTNNQSDWDPVIEKINADGYMILTYDYIQYESEQSDILEDAISFARSSGAKDIVLIGASRGGVASIKAAAGSAENGCIIGVAALSAPIQHEGIVFYSSNELSRIRIQALLVNSESDDGADDTRKMYEHLNGPKDMLFYPGNGHGTELFNEHRESLVRKLISFTESVFAGRP